MTRAKLPRALKGPVRRVLSGAKGAAFVALPDTGEVEVTLDDTGQPVPMVTNQLILPHGFRSEFQTLTDRHWFEVLSKGPRPPLPWIINMLADADEYHAALVWLDATYGATVPIFNHPRAVARSRRDISARILADVPGLITPRCARFIGDSPAAFERTFADNGFAYPVLVRPCRSQTGRGLVRVEGPGDWVLAVESPDFGLAHYMTQFVDFGTADGVWLKARVVFVGGRVFVRHIKAAAGWLVHNHSQGRLGGFDDEELRLAAALNDNAAFCAACAEVARRTGLDFCGMDVGIDVDRGRFVLFECNAAMSVFFVDRPNRTPAQLARQALFVTPAADALTALIKTPAAWACASDNGAWMREGPSFRALTAGGAVA